MTAAIDIKDGSMQVWMTDSEWADSEEVTAPTAQEAAKAHVRAFVDINHVPIGDEAEPVAVTVEGNGVKTRFDVFATEEVVPTHYLTDVARRKYRQVYALRYFAIPQKP